MLGGGGVGAGMSPAQHEVVEVGVGGVVMVSVVGVVVVKAAIMACLW